MVIGVWRYLRISNQGLAHTFLFVVWLQKEKNMKTIVIWKLSVFCGFYGRIVPIYANNEEEEITSFHTSTRNPDIDDLDVLFEPNLSPMPYMQLIADARDLYVMGHGNSWRSMGGRSFYSSYTLYNEQGIMAYLKNALAEDKAQSTWDTLKSLGQAKINID